MSSIPNDANLYRAHDNYKAINITATNITGSTAISGSSVFGQTAKLVDITVTTLSGSTSISGSITRGTTIMGGTITGSTHVSGSLVIGQRLVNRQVTAEGAPPSGSMAFGEIVFLTGSGTAYMCYKIPSGSTTAIYTGSVLAWISASAPA